MVSQKSCARSCCDAIILIVLIGVYIGYNIDFLNRYYDDWKSSCSQTNLWPFNLTSFLTIILTLSFNRSFYNYLEKNNKKLIKSTMIIQALIYILILFWGFIELFDTSWIELLSKYKLCQQLQKSEFWEIGIGNFSLMVLITIVFIYELITKEYSFSTNLGYVSEI